MATPLQVRDCFCLHGRRTSRLLTQYYDDALRVSGLRITQFLLLAAIREAGPVAHQALADLLGMDRTTLTRNLALVERDGLAEVVKGTDDRREKRIRLTRAGQRAVERALPYWQSAQQQLLERLNSSPDGTGGEGALSLLDRLGRVAAEL
jgi:DNA-binding MarR family transcriptional regulator